MSTGAIFYRGNWFPNIVNKIKAKAISYNNSSSGLQSTDIQSAVDELVNSISEKQNTITLDTVIDSTSTNPVQNKVIANALSTYWKILYPVGSIYFSVNNTNPENFFGGKWTAYGTADTYLRLGGNSSGGSNTYSLTENNIPSHTHVITAHSHGLNSHKHSIGGHSHGLNSHQHDIPELSGYAGSAGNHTHSINICWENSWAHWLGYSGNVSGTGVAAQYGYLAIDGGGWAMRAGEAGSHSHTITTYKTTSGEASGSTANNASFDSGAASGSTEVNKTCASGSYGASSVTAIDITPKYVQVYAWRRTE